MPISESSLASQAVWEYQLVPLVTLFRATPGHVRRHSREYIEILLRPAAVVTGTTFVSAGLRVACPNPEAINGPVADSDPDWFSTNDTLPSVSSFPNGTLYANGNVTHHRLRLELPITATAIAFDSSCPGLVRLVAPALASTG